MPRYAASRGCVYGGVIGMESFAPWLERLEKQMTERVLDGFLREIPPEPYTDVTMRSRALPSSCTAGGPACQI